MSFCSNLLSVLTYQVSRRFSLPISRLCFDNLRRLQPVRFVTGNLECSLLPVRAADIVFSGRAD